MKRRLYAALVAGVLVGPAGASAQESSLPRAVARIGCEDCSGPRLLTDVRDLTLAHGRVYVVDGAPPHIRIFDLSGRSVRAFGRVGDGPGEFRFPIHLHVWPDSQFEVFDAQHSRLTRFNATGVQQGTRTIGLGQFPVLTSSIRNPDIFVVASTIRDTVQQVLRMSPDSLKPANVPIGKPVNLTIREGHVMRPALAARPDSGLAIGNGTDDYRILILRADGSTESAISRTLDKVRKTAAELEADRRVRDMLRQRMRRHVPDGNLPRPSRDEFRRHFNAMAYDDAGRLWVRTERRIDVTVFDLFDAQNEYLGEYIVPDIVGAFAIGSGVIAVAVADDLGVPYVVLYRTK